MDRRLLVIPGGILVALVVISGFVGVVSWQADLYATEQNLESAEAITAGDLPDDCRQFTESLAASQNVSLKEYRLSIGSTDIYVRDTPEKGWAIEDTTCIPRLAFENNLHVGDDAYNVRGHTTKSMLHLSPQFVAMQLLGGLVGVVMLTVGLRAMYWER